MATSMEQIRALNEVISMITDHVQFTSFVHHVNLPPKKTPSLGILCQFHARVDADKL